MAAISEQKRNYSSLDHGDWVRWWNAVNVQSGQPDKNIDFYWADKFPIRTPTVLRAVLAEPKLEAVLCTPTTCCAFCFCIMQANALLDHACWERNLDMSSDEVLAQVIDKAGHDSKRVLERANSPSVKKELRSRTAQAKELGICGVPTYIVFHRKAGSAEEWKQRGDMVWGQDELAVVEDLIAGSSGDDIARVQDHAKLASSKL